MFKTGGLSLNTTPANTGTTQTGGGLFGNTQQNTQQKPGGLFGTTAQTQTGGTSLFGNQQQQGGGGLFGNQPQQQQPQQQTGSLFGQQSTNTGGGLFGQSQNQTQQKPGGLFGQSTAQQSTGGGLTMGQSTNQQTVPGVRIDLANVKGTTKFNDLTPELQKEIEACDNMIQTFVSQAEQIKSFREGHKAELDQLTHDVEWLERKFNGVKTTLEEDVQMTAQLKDLVKSDAQIAKAAFSGAEQLKLPAQYHTTWLTASKPPPRKAKGSGAAGAAGGGGGGGGTSGAAGEEDADLEDCITLFSREAERLSQLHKSQVQKIKDLEHHMPGVQNGLYERMSALRDGAPQMAGFGFVVELLDTVKALNDEIVRAAGEIVETREKLTRLQLRSLPRK
ncbi:hypothetical protein ACRALDRAFT_2024887 [Sodiomyces alcalophilus JCM 7366]|uniref:uncharacterized protein n=1 Tax=Sodiomyces alcalophilus JCM 7366 TaxID=591952 RepID=UPI0039B47264